MKKFNNNKGSMLVILIIAMTLIAVLGASFVSFVGSKQQGFTYLLDGHRANMIAKAGVEWAIRFASEGNDVNVTKDFVPGKPEEGSFSTSYDGNGDLTVVGTYRGIKATIKLSNFSQYFKSSDESFSQSISDFEPKSQAGESITVAPAGAIRLGQGVRDTFGAVWYGGNSTAGNCVSGACDFGSGFRAYFVFQFASGSKGDGFTFAIVDGTNNTVSSVGGDTRAGELMGYGGDSRSYSGGYISSFVDGSGSGLRPPKFAVEFDIYPNTGCDPCSLNSRCDPSNQHMAYVFWGNDNRIGCMDNYTRWMSSFEFPANTVIYGTTGNVTYLYRSMNSLTTGKTQPAWPTGKGDTVGESGEQWKECSWRADTNYVQGDVVAPTSANGFFFRVSQSGKTGLVEPNWTNCVNSGTECIDGSARWKNAFFYGFPILSVNYVTSSSTYDDNRHTAGTGTNPTNTTSSDSYYTSPPNPTAWLADTVDSSTVNRTYAYRMEVHRAAGTYQIKSWIVTCDPAWSPSTVYTINDMIRPTGNNGYYYIARTDGTSGATPPTTWPTSGTVADGTVTWEAVEIPPAWSPFTVYTINDMIRPTGNNGYYYIARTDGTSGDKEPDWPASRTITDGTVTWLPIQRTVCNKYTNGAFGNVRSDYTADPTLYRTVTIDEEFDKFLFGWTTASGGATQKADVWKFRMSFRR